MKSVIVLVTLLCLIVSATAMIGAWPKPYELSNEELLMETSHHHNYHRNQFNFGDSKIWKCTYNNGSGAAVSISYPGPPPPSQPSPSPKPNKSPPPPKPTPKMSPPPPKPSPPPPTLSPRRPSLPPPQTPKKSPPQRKESTPSSPSPPPAESTRPEPPSTRFTDPWGHFLSCYNNMVPSAICRQQMELSYFTGTFSVNDYCCNLIVNMTHDCTDVVLGFFNDPFFVPLLRYTCHVKY